MFPGGQIYKWSHGELTPELWESRGGDPTALAAQFWVSEVSRILADKEVLSVPQYIEIHYEELTTEPESTIDKILDFAELPWSKEFRDFVRSFKLRNHNVNTKDRLSRDQIETIDAETGKTCIPARLLSLTEDRGAMPMES